ncbi:hypothetical protein MTO96_041561 [Rhipicephalus appendiculatus]
MADYGASEYKPEFHWVACHGDQLPENAVPGGDDMRGDVTYVGRATCLSPNGAPLAWLPESNGAVPSGAIQGGKSHDGEPLYIGRAKHNGMLTIGKVHPSKRRLYVSFGYKEYSYTEYEVLVCKTINL